MYVTNVSELVAALKPRLQDYLVMQLGEEARQRKFKCFVHEDSNPSMHYNPKTDDTTVRCFACNESHDIFSACAHIEGMPANGPEWITRTLPHLAQKLEIEVKFGEASPEDKARLEKYRLTSDISEIIESGYDEAKEYVESRGWSNEFVTIGSVDSQEIISSLISKGWSNEQIQTSRYFPRKISFFGKDKITFVIKDYSGRPIAFSSRNVNYSKDSKFPKYINTPETTIYSKGKTLFGLDVALAEAKRNGIYIVEGQGDVTALHKHGIKNVAATCGTAFTSDHLALLKMLGVRHVYFCMDWDEAGTKAILRTLQNEIQLTPGVSCWVVKQPESGEKDPGEYLESNNANAFRSLEKTGAFEWLVSKLKENTSSEDLCANLIPVIAVEASAVRRELLIVTLANITGFSHEAISSDINALRDNEYEERKERLSAVADQFQRDVVSDPDSIQSYISEMENKVEYIESEYKKNGIGINYQINRYDALQEAKQRQAQEGLGMGFKMTRFTSFRDALSGGMTWAEGVLIYLGGRANSGKTATAIALGTDVAISDEEAIVVMHFTDDNYAQVEPRIKSNIAEQLREAHEQSLSIGAIANPWQFALTKDQWDYYYQADDIFRKLIKEERIIVIDSEDGATLATLEKVCRDIRKRHPDKKLLIIQDNTHNLRSFPNLDQTARMTKISTCQKDITGKYRCCLIATAEYRKNTPADYGKLRLPVDDDLADARALIYRPNMIIHVYNDLHDRKDQAEIVYHKEPGGVALPRLMLIISKNKISKFKDKLMMDLDPDTVTLNQYSAETARIESVELREKLESGEARYVKTENGQMVIEADWE